MRVVVLTEIISPYRIPVFNALARQPGIELHVIFLAENDAGLRQWKVYKEEICFSYQVLSSWRRRLGKYNLLLNWGVTAALRRAKPEIIVCGGYNYVASWKALLWARRRRVPFLLWIESTGKDQRAQHAWVESAKRRFLRQCSAFVVPGKSSFDYLKSFGVMEEAIFTAPNAVDIKFFGDGADKIRETADINREAMALPSRYYIFVGRLVPEKGVFDLLRAYGTLAAEVRREIGLVFVGDGPARFEVEQMAAKVSPGQVEVIGFAHRETLARYYGLAETLVFPTHTDPWGLVVNEAMAAGLPIIATSAAGCTADLVEDNWNGRVVEAGDWGQLCSAMGQLARDGRSRSLMGLRSRQRIAAYSPEACASAMAGAARAQRAAG
jgi:glycosyltransferase involved in cell wall biosynthesis